VYALTLITRKQRMLMLLSYTDVIVSDLLLLLLRVADDCYLPLLLYNSGLCQHDLGLRLQMVRPSCGDTTLIVMR
jgi:hypothetical protein